MIEKYGKKCGDLLKIKKDFYAQNDSLLKARDKVASVYRKQQKRTVCKLCGVLLNMNNDFIFISHQIEYCICSNCSHINGAYEDTYEFSNYIYCEQDYGDGYSEKGIEEYDKRMELIYLPKVRFLKEALDIEKFRVLDIGAGSGYFCAAALREGIEIEGIEISKQQVAFANAMIGQNILRQIDADDMLAELMATDRNVVSAIGVLEHIYNLREVLKAIRENKNIDYLYFSVPLFSLSVYLEMIFQNGFNRQLGGGHTHLFTMESIQYMCQEFGFEIIGKWQFGTDVMDMYRFMVLQLEGGGQSDYIIRDFSEKFLSCADALQYVIDKAGFGSEIHLLAKINRGGLL